MSENSPYTPPAAAVADATAEYGEVKIFSASGRLGRLRYITYLLAVTFVTFVLFGAIAALTGGALDSTAYMLGVGVVYIASLVISVMIAVQRLHDLDKTGWLYLLFLVPILNIIFALYVLFWPGTKGTNRYGNPPPPNGAGVIVTGVLMLVAFGGIMAISIPAYNSYVQKAQEMQMQQLQQPQQ